MDDDGGADAPEDGDAPIVGVVCGACLEGVPADRVPTWCPRCRARYDRDAPHAVVRFGAVVGDREVGLGLAVDFLGQGWTHDAVERVRAEVFGGEDDD